MNKTVALIVTYNRKNLLKECIEGLTRSETPCDIFVIDNASTDGTQEAMQDYVDRGVITYHNTGANLGGAGGFNYALKTVLKQDYDYFWIMDDDCIVQPDSLTQLMRVAKVHPDFGFLSSRVLWTDGTRCRMNEQKLLEGSLDADKPQRCRQATFVSLLLRAEAVQKAGLPISEFFIWGDDVEYTRRLSKMFTCWYVPASVVIHKTANNEGSNIATDSAARLPRYRFAYRNEVYIAKKEKGSRILYQGAKVLYHSARVLIKAPDHKLERLGIIWSGSREGLSFDPRVEKVQ